MNISSRKFVQFVAVAALTAFLSCPANARGGPWAGVIGYWRANFNSEDLSGNLATVEAAPIPLVQGVQGRAFHFDGSRSLDTVYDASISPGQVTVALWVRPTVVSEGCCQGLVATENWLLETKERNIPQFFVVADEQGAVVPQGSPPELPANTWTHVAAVYDGSALALYINGEQWGPTTPLAGTLKENPSRGFLSLGSEDGRANCPSCQGTRRYTGDMDEVVAVGYAMTAEEIGVMYRSGVLPALGH